MPDNRTVNQIDLHVHTRASQDGQYPPGEVLAQLRDHGLRVAAFADHDTVESVAQGVRLASDFGLEFVPAVELTTSVEGHELHVLAYFIDPQEPRLIRMLRQAGDARLEQGRLRCARLRELGFAIDYDRVLELAAGKSPTAYPIFQAVMENPVNADFTPARRYRNGDRSNSPVYNFARDYFLKDGPAYVPALTPVSAEAIRVVRDLGAVPVLAHPARTPLTLVQPLVSAGLMGLEVFNTSHSAQETDRCLDLARRLALLVTAGSDFHGPQIKPDVLLARLPQAGYDLYEKLLQARDRIR